MRVPSPPRRPAIGKPVIGLLIGTAAWAVAAMISMFVPNIGAVEDLAYDWRLTTTRPAPEIVVILIDESSLRTLAPAFGRWPWPRIVHAGVIDFLARAPAKVVAYDVLFIERDARGPFSLGGS